MKLLRLQITGFKNPDRKVDFFFSKEKITVIYGENGCGKTTLLKVIQAILQKNNEVLLEENIKHICVTYLKDGEKKQTNINVEGRIVIWEPSQKDLFDSTSILFGEHWVTDLNSLANLMRQINLKIADLEPFAMVRSVTFEDLKLIVKGKWYLFSYVYHLIPIIRDLKNKCNAVKIPQCRSCLAGNLRDCLYKLKVNVTNVNIFADSLYNDIKEYIDEESLSDVIGLFKGLNPEIV